MQMASKAQKESEINDAMEDDGELNEPLDPRHVTVLSETEWQRIQDKLNLATREEELLRVEAERKKALLLKSKEAVKNWPDVFTGVMQKKLEEKRKREEIEEEKKILIDIEEAKYQQQKKKEILERAKTQILHRTERVKELHSALLLTEVLKEREAQIELRERINATRDRDKLLFNTDRDKEAARSEQECAEQRRLDRIAHAEDLKIQIKEKEAMREQEKLKIKKEREEILRLHGLFEMDQKMELERQETEMKNLMQAHMELMAIKDLARSMDAQKQEAEEEQRRVYHSAKLKNMKERQNQEREALKSKHKMQKRLGIKLLIDTSEEDKKIAQAIAEKEAKEDLQWQQKEEERASMLKSIAEHRELVKQEKEQRDKTEKQERQNEMQAYKERLRISTEQEEMDAKIKREGERAVQDFNVSQMAEKRVRRGQLKLGLLEEIAREVQLVATDDMQFQKYSQTMISEAAEKQRNLFPLCKAAMAGLRGGRHRDDSSNAEVPYSVSRVVRMLNEPADFEGAKRRLGFMG